MPNWCDNTLEINHSDIKMMRRFVKGWNRKSLLNEFIPVPPELSDGSMNWKRIMELQNEKRNREYADEMDKFREELNLKYFGYRGWYEFCLDNWGTKWDIGYDLDCGDYLTADSARKPITVRFYSAWSPPTDAYRKLSEMGFSIRAYYYESGMGFCGSWVEGHDQCFEIKEFTSAWVRENIPSDIDDYMGISDCMQLDEECEDA